jgi:hypothetical protein
MAAKSFTATLSQAQGRTGLCMIFRHPVRSDRNGKLGLRIRRGLGTSDEAEARRLVAQMNEILSEEALWKPSQRSTAAEKYDSRIVAAFFDDLTPPVLDNWALRDRIISLPGPEMGYVRTKLLGTTGSGKTTLLRQFIGTDPETERFPSTSTAKTTTCDIEVVMRDGDFKAAVSFLPKDRIRQFVEDSVTAAIMAKVEGRQMSEVARKFLQDREQRFRLSYMLGSVVTSIVADEDLTEDEDDEPPRPSEISEISAEERQMLQARLHEYLKQIEQLAKTATAELAKELDFNPAKASREERDTFQEMLEEHLTEEPEFQELVDQIMDDCESRFELLSHGAVEWGKDKWPLSWEFTAASENREGFLKAVNRFSSNFAPNFGRLLTPMVEGIRVAGPFKPDWLDSEPPKLVLLDGEGLGHTPASASTISTRITKRFELADTILLVDSASQPMQAAPITVLNSLVASGHESKLAICFTHFDEVKGDNLPNVQTKRDHVLGSLDNAIAAVGKSHGHLAETALKEAVADRTVFLANLQDSLPDNAHGTRKQLRKLLEILKASIKPLEPSDFVPVYDDANLVLLVQQAMEEFREPWRARLKLSSTSSVPPEHWTRVKALSRHISQLGADEYDNLQPVAEFIAQLQAHIARFLASPVYWEPNEPPTEDLINRATAAVRQHVFQQLHSFAHSRLIDAHLRDWSEAFSAHSGRGSTVDRARDIEGIYSEAAPIPTGVAEKNANDFLLQVRRLVGKSIHEGGGRLHSGDYPISANGDQAIGETKTSNQ